MPARKKPTKRINLLPQEEFAASTTGRVLHWLLSTFRYMVITTEMVVISAFISRFYFDSRIADLNEEIKQKQDFIGAYSSFEQDFRLAQDRLAIFADMTLEERMARPAVEELVLLLPKNTQLTRLVFKTSETQIMASTLVEQSIEQFIVNLKSNKRYKNVSLGQIESQANSPFINFTLNVPKDKITEEEKPEEE